MTNDVHALAGAFVLDAVTELERAAFARHLAECDSCATEVAEMREAAARLADGAWSVPPPRLRTDVMATIARTRQLGPVTSTRPASERDTAVARWRSFAAGAAAAVVTAVGAGAVTYAVQEQRVRENAAVAAAAQAREARTRAIFSDPDVVVRTAPVAGGGQVTLALSRSQDAGVVVLAARSAPPAGRAFQLWTVRGGSPVSAGALAAGTASAVQIVDGLPGSEGFGVTVEPAGGSTSPTLPMVASVSLN